jgi:hypothetical protein
MFGTLRKHQTWLWGVIITLTVISFVIYFSPDAKWNLRGHSQSDYGLIDGRTVTRQEAQDAQEETRLFYFLRFQKMPENDERARQMGFDVEERAQIRLVELAKARQEKIRVSDQVVGQTAKEIVEQIGQRWLQTRVNVDMFVKQILNPVRVTEADFERLLRNDAAIQQLVSVVGLPGQLVPPREAEAAYRHENEELELQAVLVFASNYLARVTVTETNLLQWYSNNTFSFRVPEKISMSYVEFPRSNFLVEADKQMADITNLNLQLDQFYSSRDPKSFTNESGQVLTKEKAIEKIKQNDRERRAMAAAYRKANEFATQLFDEKDHGVAAFEKYATNQGWKVRVTAPFDDEEGPKDLKITVDGFTHSVFGLTNKEEAVIFQPIPAEESFYVMALKDRLPSSNPSFTAIRSNVVERYRFSEARDLAREAANAFQSKLTNRLTQITNFADAAASSNLKLVRLPPVSRASRQVPGLPENIDLGQLKIVAFSLQVGQATPYLSTMDGGVILFLKDRLPFVEQKVKAELPGFMAGLQAQRQNQAFDMWFRKQFEAAALPPTRAAAAKAEAGKTEGAKPSGKQPKKK